jgi:hypothetical protein
MRSIVRSPCHLDFPQPQTGSQIAYAYGQVEAVDEAVSDGSVVVTDDAEAAQ